MELILSDKSIVNYKKVGKGKPIIILHGFSLDHRSMEGCLEPVFNNIRTRQQYCRYYVDLPGMGKSKASEQINNSDDMLKVIIEFIDKVIPGEQFLLAGYSYGGYLSRGIIYRMKDRVGGLMLLCSVIIADSQNRNLPERKIFVNDENLRKMLESEGNEKNLDVFNDLVIQNSAIWERCRKEIVSGILIGNQELLEKLSNNYSFSFEKEMKNVFTKPTLILAGKQDTIVGYYDNFNIYQFYPRATMAVLDMAGHTLQIEQENVFNCLVENWLKRLTL